MDSTFMAPNFNAGSGASFGVRAPQTLFQTVAIILLNELAAAGAEREETNSTSAHALRCRHSAARNATACLTSASNNAFTGCRRAMDRTVDWMGCSCDRQRKTRHQARR